MSKRARVLLTILAFVAVNLAITALPATAGARLRNGLCQSGESGEIHSCCVKCYFFCSCDALD